MPTVTGKECKIEDMSDGLRSLFYISLVDSILDVESKIQQEIDTDYEHISFNHKPPILTIIALEEPENHIAQMCIRDRRYPDLPVYQTKNISGSHALSNG